MLTPERKLQRAGSPADLQLLSGVKEETPERSSSLDQEDSEPPERSSSLDQEDSDPPHIKEEQEWSSPEGDQLQGLEETETTKSTFSPVPVKSEDYEEDPQSSQLHQRHMDCGGPGPDRDSEPETEVKIEDCSEPDTEDSEDWEETFKQKPLQTGPTRTGSGEKPFSCSQCRKRFKQRGHLTQHTRVHTGEKPFICSECGKRFTQKSSLTLHLVQHREEKPYGCSECGKRFNRKFSLTLHMVLHSGQKPFGCPTCGLRFSWRTQLKRHECVGGPGPGPDRDSGPKRQPETEDSEEDWRETRGLNPLRNDEVPQSPATCESNRKHLLCSESEEPLRTHRDRHTTETPSSGSGWNNQSTERGGLDQHIHKEGLRGAEQEDPEPRVIKEEQEEVWISQAETTKSTFSPVPVKSEDDEEGPQSSQLHQRHTEHMDRGGPGPDGDSGPETEGSSEAEDSDFWKETRRPRSSLKHMRMSADVSGWDSLDETSSCWDDKPSDGLDPETDDSVDRDFWTETRKRPSEDVQHQQPKTKKKSHSCSSCEKVFKSKQSLRIHTRTHTGERPYCCSECGRRFDRRGSLTRHMLVHQGEKPFGCSDCSKTFNRKGHLARHMLVHTKEKPFGCSQCGKWFKHQYNLTVHMSHHRGEKPFGCPVCQRRFSWPVHLRKHECVGGTREDCGGPEPERASDPETPLQPETESKTEDSSGPGDRDLLVRYSPAL